MKRLHDPFTPSAPTPAAPTVWATVFKDRIADNGLSIFTFKSKNYFTNLKLFNTAYSDRKIMKGGVIFGEIIYNFNFL
jgi:hypothetical protein